MTWQIWREGFLITGGYSDASFVGQATGNSFKEACLNWFKKHPDPNFNPDTLSVWGCQLFCNETMARKSFG